MSRARAVSVSWTSVTAPAGQVTAARGAQISRASRRERILSFQQTGAPFCWMQALDAGVIQGRQQTARDRFMLGALAGQHCLAPAKYARRVRWAHGEPLLCQPLMLSDQHRPARERTGLLLEQARGRAELVVRHVLGS